MVDESKNEGVAAAMQQINRAWLQGCVEDMALMVHPGIVMVFPGFTARTAGREDFLAAFRDFRRNATIHEFREQDRQIDVVGDTAVVNFKYEMIYDRSGKRYRATGRDLWVFQKPGEAWLAVWRTMLELEENAA
ncbi:MAG: nuclear transport factor 2 family protein [Bryobacteraceae bacterium]